MERNRRYTVLVNSSDGFADCWDAFFTLFRRYWPDCTARVLLNTECARWHDPNGDVESTRVQGDCSAPRLSWSHCLERALGQVSTPLVLYLQEDYFLEAVVDNAAVEEYAAMMANDPGIAHIGLTTFGRRGPFAKYADERLCVIPQRAPYRISTQAGLWRVDVLKSYLRRDENGWMFEFYGTWRARRRNERFLMLNPLVYGIPFTAEDVLAEADRAAAGEGQLGQVIPYAHAGIVKGKWVPYTADLLRREGVALDFSKRGFMHRRPALIRRLQTLKKILAQPSVFLANLLELRDSPDRR